MPQIHGFCGTSANVFVNRMDIPILKSGEEIHHFLPYCFRNGISPLSSGRYDETKQQWTMVGHSTAHFRESAPKTLPAKRGKEPNVVKISVEIREISGVVAIAKLMTALNSCH